MSTESVVSSNHLILCGGLLLLPSVFPSIRVFSNELALHIRWPKYWSFSFSISPSSGYSRLVSFRVDWSELPAVQGALRSLLQPHRLKSPLLCLLCPQATINIQNTSDTRYLRFCPHQAVLGHRLGSYSLSSDTVYLETASDPTGEGFSPMRSPPLSDANGR